jgi:hypothetical protein
MLTFNTILRNEGIDPKSVRLVRHQDNNRSSANSTPYNLWRAGDGRLETYQRIQTRKPFKVGEFLASFVVTPSKDTLFVGLYHVDGIGAAPHGTIDPVRQADREGANFYDIRHDDRLSDYVGHLVIDWGKGYIQWAQRAAKSDKMVLEIRKETREEPFPGFTQFYWDIDQIAAVPLRWQEVLRSVKGVYLLICKETGKQYIGSAKGEENFWGRFLDHAKKGHGDSVELKRLGSKKLQVTVLEVVHSDTGIERTEEAWKKKLMTRQFGLNKN